LTVKYNTQGAIARADDWLEDSKEKRTKHGVKLSAARLDLFH